VTLVYVLYAPCGALDPHSFPTRRSSDLLDALRQDLGKPRIEGWSTDVAYTRSEVRLLHRNLERWTAPERVRLPLLSLPGSGRIRSEEHTSELQSRENLVCRLLLEKKNHT